MTTSGNVQADVPIFAHVYFSFGVNKRSPACDETIVSLEPQLIGQLLLLGICIGFLAGLLGVGGGMLMVPFLTAILDQRGVEAGLAIKMAIATSMATILFTSISSVWAHHKRGAVRWKIVRNMAPGILIGGLLAGAGAFAALKGAWLALLFAAFVAFSGFQMISNKKPSPTRRMPAGAGILGVGGIIGFLSGLVAAGGGFLSVPFMIWCNVSAQHAVATSAALGFPIALANTGGYVVGGWSLPSAIPGAVGYVYLPALAVLALASVSLAPLGVRAAHAINVVQLKRLFAWVLFLLSGYMLFKGLTTLYT